MDDEYFVKMIAMRRDVAGQPAVARVLDAVLRSFEKPQQRRFTEALMRSLKSVVLLTPGGRYLGEAPGYDVDLGRLCRVIERTTLGLYFHEFGRRMPDNLACRVYALDGFSLEDAAVTAKVRQLFAMGQNGTPRMLGDSVFMYWFQSFPEPDGASLWVHRVYGGVAFVALTVPPASMPDPSASRDRAG